MSSARMNQDDVHRPQASQAQRTAEAKAAFTASLKSVGANIDSELQAKAKTIHSMDESLTKQEKDLRQNTKKLARQNDDMQKFVNKSSKQLASFGDLDTLHSNVDADLDDIEAMLDMMEQESSRGVSH